MSSSEPLVVNSVDDDEMEIDLMELFTELISHWGKIAVSTILAGAIFFAYTFFLITPQYTSTSILYVVSASTSITSLSDLQIGSYLTSDYIEVVTGRPVLDQVIENLGLEDIEYADLYQKVDITNPDDSRLLEITVTDPDPQLAKDIADEIAEVSSLFIAEKMDQEAPTIIQYGYVATEKTSPSITKNTLIGALLGAILAIALICITYLLNDTIMAPDDIEKRLGLNVLASLPKEESSETDDYHDSPRKKKNRSA